MPSFLSRYGTGLLAAIAIGLYYGLSVSWGTALLPGGLFLLLYVLFLLLSRKFTVRNSYAILFALSGSALSVGLLLKIQHWPGGGYLLVLGFGAAVTALFVFAGRLWPSPLVIVPIGFAGILVSRLFILQAWPYGEPLQEGFQWLFGLALPLTLFWESRHPRPTPAIRSVQQRIHLTAGVYLLALLLLYISGKPWIPYPGVAEVAGGLLILGVNFLIAHLLEQPAFREHFPNGFRLFVFLFYLNYLALAGLFMFILFGFLM